MGWSTTTYSTTIKDQVNDFLRRNHKSEHGYQILEYSLRGNVLWFLCISPGANGPEGPAIGCTLFKRYRDGIVGWKDMCESMHPYYYNVPLHYLKKAAVVNQEWRDGVAAYYARLRRKFNVGDTVRLHNCGIPEVTLTSIKPLRGIYGGVLYRLRPSLIA